MNILIYIKFKLGITHFAHNYMEILHVAFKPKLQAALAQWISSLNFFRWKILSIVHLG